VCARVRPLSGPKRERRLLVTLSLLGNVLLLAALYLGDGGGCVCSRGGTCFWPRAGLRCCRA
jgi:hypothetical protein